MTLTHWTGPDGATLEETSLSVNDDEACESTPTGDLTPYSAEYEGYMGNWGNTARPLVSPGGNGVWPRERTSPTGRKPPHPWAIDELAEMALRREIPADARAE